MSHSGHGRCRRPGCGRDRRRPRGLGDQHVNKAACNHVMALPPMRRWGLRTRVVSAATLTLRVAVDTGRAAKMLVVSALSPRRRRSWRRPCLRRFSTKLRRFRHPARSAVPRINRWTSERVNPVRFPNRVVADTGKAQIQMILFRLKTREFCLFTQAGSLRLAHSLRLVHQSRPRRPMRPAPPISVRAHGPTPVSFLSHITSQRVEREMPLPVSTCTSPIVRHQSPRTFSALPI